MIALLMQLLGDPARRSGLQPYLLTTQFDAWQGLLRDADRLGADRARRLGLRALRCRRWRSRTWCSCGATSPAGKKSGAGA